MELETIEITTTSADETERLGSIVAEYLAPGSLVALRGDLAAGKTCFVRGMARHVAPEADVTSPTFTLVHEYGGEPTLYHLDLYRLASIDEIRDLGYEDLFGGLDGIAIIEWAELAEPLLPKRRLDIRFAHAGADKRTVTLLDGGVLTPGWVEALAQFR